MRVLMFGWEFPPFKSGGLGTACQGMATALAKKGTEIFFVLPRAESDRPVHLQDGLTMFSASGTRVCTRSARLRREEDVREIWHDRQYTELVPGFRDEIEEIWREKLHLEYIDSPLRPYLNSGSYLKEHRELQRLLSEKRLADPTLRTVLQHEGPEREHLLREIAETREQCETLTLHGGYGEDLMSEVYRYACAAAVIAGRLEFDVIHVHDWMTYPAGMLVKQLTGKPLVAHIHALEHDRSGDNLNQTVADIEKAGMEAADRVVAVSHYTKQEVMAQYGIPEDKISVVHNAVSRNDIHKSVVIPERCRHEKRVLFMGRVTYQKGPDYFVEAAKLVLDRLPHTRFIMAGSGDMLPNMVRRVAHLRIGDRFHFTGFLRNGEVDRMYAMSDLYVMPSVSEPFGIAPLEAMAYDVPVLISRQSGVAEVVRNAIKVDFWDVREMANKICALLAYPLSKAELYGGKAINKFIIFTMYFGGGMIPNYILMVSLGLRDTVASFILPGMISTYYIILMRSFFLTLPRELEEAGEIDGLDKWGVFWRIAIPLSKPIIATMTLFYVVQYWNDWFDAFLYLDTTTKWPVAYYLRQLISSASGTSADAGDAMQIASNIKSCAMVLTSAPIICIYPFIQKYFVQGMMLGGVKG